MPKIDKNRHDLKRRRTTYFNGFNIRWSVLAGVFCLNKLLHRLRGYGSICQNADALNMGYDKQPYPKNKEVETCLNNGLGLLNRYGAKYYILRHSDYLINNHAR